MDDTSVRTIGFDIGGTSLRAGVVDASGTLLDSRSVPTPGQTDELIEAVLTLVRELRAEHEIAAVGLAVAGFLDVEGEIVRFAPHLPLRNFPLRKHLRQHLDIPVLVEHDANSAAWGEARFGAAQGAGTWVFFSVGTGIGAALMNNGVIYRGAYGTAPEFGHITVVPDGRKCSCGKRGCLERYASGTALVDSAQELLASGVGVGSDLHQALLNTPAAVDGGTVMAAARDGDELGGAVVDAFSARLGEGLAIVADVLDPALIVVGGGVSNDADLYLDTAAEAMAARIVGAGHRPSARLATAELGPDAGMIGVSDLARTLI